MKLKGNPTDLYNQITEHLESLNPEKSYICYIEERESKESRTLAQNRTFWKIFTGIGNHLGYKKEVVRSNILKALFGTYECKMFGEIHLVANKSSTTELDKKQGIEVIDASLAYAKKIGAGIEITSAEVKSLYDSYN